MNPTNPTTLISANFMRTMLGSSSAPARNVRTTAPEAARNVTQSESAASTSPRLKNSAPAAMTTPTQISTNAIERRSEDAMRAETTARASHRVAVRKIDSIDESSVPAKAHAALSRSPPDQRQSYGYGSSRVGVISPAKALIRGTPSPGKDQYTRNG